MTQKEALIKVYNGVMERKAAQMTDSAYFKEKAKYFGKKHPEYHPCLQKAEQNESELFWTNLTLKTIQTLIQKEEEKEKKS